VTLHELECEATTATNLTVIQFSCARYRPAKCASNSHPPALINMPETSHPLVFSFTYHPSSSPFRVSSEKYIANHPGAEYKYLATGALVFDDSNPSAPRILLIQRSASDSSPGRWEIPGGGVDDDDESILHAVARELWEEAGLTAVSIGPLVGSPYFFESRSGKHVCKFSFLVEMKIGERTMDVKLNPEEHQRFVWASEEEAKARKVGDLEIEFTVKDMEETVLEAFRIRREAKEMLTNS
jgi:8-oxo-dGTP pyrophosphatase MutT (NUDIX family)